MNERDIRRTLFLLFKSKEEWDFAISWCSRYIHTSVKLKQYDGLFYAMVETFIRNVVKFKNFDIVIVEEILNNLSSSSIKDKKAKEKIDKARFNFLELYSKSKSVDEKKEEIKA